MPPPSLPALGGITTILRLPAEGGTILGYTPDSLNTLDWQSGRGIPPLRAVLGYDLDGRIVWAVDARDRLVGIDLEAGQARAYIDGVRQATVGPDGAAFVVDTGGRTLRLLRRATTVMPAQFQAPPTALFGGLGGRVLAVERATAPGEARLISEDRAGTAVPLGGGPVAATFWGELMAVAERDEVALLRSSDGNPVRRLRLSRPAEVLGFSPSGHRLYALEGDRLQWFDRFTGDRLGTLDLPAEAGAFRIDPSGRWMLVQRAAVDSAWLVDLATGQLAGALLTGWRDDLPLVAGASAVLTLRGEDVVGYRLAGAEIVPAARIVRGGSDLWLPLPWVPPGRATEAMAELAEAQARQDEDLSIGTGEAREDVWLQVSSSQNPEWAEDLARQLADEGFPTAVWRPRDPEDGYRVVVGPFPDRPTAEETGRKLDRPFFVVGPRRPPE